jgi:HlyD family secretion protein
MARQVGASQGGSGRRGRGGPRAAQTVYKLSTGKEEPVAVQIRTGISDGRVTQIVSGPLVPGEQVVTGAVTTKADSSGSAVPVGGARGAGGGRRGF